MRQIPRLREWLKDKDISYVMAVPRSQRCATAAGPFRADELAARVPARGWQVLSCGEARRGFNVATRITATANTTSAGQTGAAPISHGPPHRRNMKAPGPTASKPPRQPPTLHGVDR